MALRDALLAIQHGTTADRHGWMTRLGHPDAGRYRGGCQILEHDLAQVPDERMMKLPSHVGPERNGRGATSQRRTTDGDLMKAMDPQTIDPYSADFLADPFPYLQHLRNAGPAVLLERYGVWAVAGHEHVDAILRDYTTFSSASGTGIDDLKKSSWRDQSILLEADPPTHTVNRRAVNRAVAPQRTRNSCAPCRAARRLAGRRTRRKATVRRRRRVGRGLSQPRKVFPEAFGLEDQNEEHAPGVRVDVFQRPRPSATTCSSAR